MTALELFLVVALVLVPSAVRASADVCGEPVRHSELAVAAANHEVSALAPMPGTSRRQYRHLDILVRNKSDALSFGFVHRYVMFNFDDIEPQTNAHLHTSFFPLHWVGERGESAFRFSIAPALSGSSNVMGHPQKYRKDTLQVLAAVAWRRDISATATARYAICGDRTFGEFRVYPSVGVEWRPHPDWTIDAGFPRSQIDYRIAANWSLSLRAGPDGNEWHVMDRDFSSQSQLHFKAYALDWDVLWQASPRISISAGVGSQLDAHYELTLRNGADVRLRAENSFRIVAGLRWRF